MNSRKKVLIISSLLWLCFLSSNMSMLTGGAKITVFADMFDTDDYNADEPNKQIEDKNTTASQESDQDLSGFQFDTNLIEGESEHNALQLSQLQKVNVIATGYTAGPESTGKTPDDKYYGITSTGVEVRRDVYSTIAADPTVFPYGTILYIPGYGFGVVADCGGAIKGNRLDLFFNTLTDVYEQWGKKEVDVFIVEHGSGHVDEETLEVLNSKEAETVMN